MFKLRYALLLLLPLLIFSCDQVEFPDDPNTPVIVMARHRGYGGWIEYNIEIYADGRVLYDLRDLFWGAGCYWATRIGEGELLTLVNAIHDSKFLKKDWPRNYAIDAPTTSLVYCRKQECKKVTFNSGVRDLVHIAELVDSVTRKDLALQVLAEETAKRIQQRLEGRNLPKLEFEYGELLFTRFDHERHAPIYSVSVQSTGRVAYNKRSDPDNFDEQITLIDSSDAKLLIGSVANSTLMFSKDSSFVAGWKVGDNADIQIRVTIDHVTQICSFSEHAPPRLTILEYVVNEMSGTPNWKQPTKPRKVEQ